MKLRIRGNSIRLRLLQTEVAALSENGIVSETIQFNASAALTYSLKVSETANEIHAQFGGDEISIFLPKDIAINWAHGSEVSLETEQKIDEDHALKILIEKDFVCLDRKDDPDNADAYPNPAANC